MSHYPIADTHTHLYFPTFDTDREEVIAQDLSQGVDLQIQIGCDECSSLAALELAKTHPHFYCTLGVHPTDVFIGEISPETGKITGYENHKPCGSLEELFAFFSQLCEENPSRVVGFGETGFDLYHHGEKALTLQKESFVRHIDLCRKYDKTLVIHSRDATNITLETLRTQHLSSQKIRGVWHCFCEGPSLAETITSEFGFMLGIGGIATYNSSDELREAITRTPIEYLITETDAPFLTPHTARKKYSRNESRFLTEVVELIAELKDMPVEETAEILFANAKRVFGIE